MPRSASDRIGLAIFDVFIIRSYRKEACHASPTEPPRYDFRLEKLRFFHLVRASCRACTHKAVIPHATLRQGRPGYTRLMSLERQLRCRNCGARGNASLDLEFRPRDCIEELRNMAGQLASVYWVPRAPGNVSTKYRCHHLCHLQMSLGRAAG